MKAIMEKYVHVFDIQPQLLVSQINMEDLGHERISNGFATPVLWEVSFGESHETDANADDNKNYNESHNRHWIK